MLAETAQPAHGEMRLVVRRMREAMNSMGREIEGLPRQPFNHAFLHPLEMQRLALAEDDRIKISTDHGAVLAQVRADDTVRPGAIAMTHCWTSAMDSQDCANNVNRLTGDDAGMQTINLMPLLTSFAVQVEVCA